MSEIYLYEEQKTKMEKLCDENDLDFTFEKSQYPIRFTIRTAKASYEQMDLFPAEREDVKNSPKASMTWILKDGELSTTVSGGTFSIQKATRQKIESILMKMIQYWQQFFFRDVFEKDAIKYGMTPCFDDDVYSDEQ